MTTNVHEKQTRARLPILIRYRAQDFETRYLEDPRALYIEEFREQHRDDGFLAIIPSEKPAATSDKQDDLNWSWSTLVWASITLASLTWIAYRLFSIL